MEKRKIALLSFLLPGLGQVYSGHYGRGISLFAAFALLANFSEARLLLPFLAVLAATEAYRNHGKPAHKVKGFSCPEALRPLFAPRQASRVRLPAFSAVGIAGFISWFVLVTPWLFPFAHQMEVNEQVERLADSVRNFRAVHGKLPEDLKAMDVKTPADPWGSSYELRPWEEEGFEIRSRGRDRKVDTKDDLAYRFRR